jgi:hypothetical protein
MVLPHSDDWGVLQIMIADERLLDRPFSGRSPLPVPGSLAVI